MAPKATPAKAGPKPKVQFMTQWHYDVLGEVKGIRKSILGLTKALLADKEKAYEGALDNLKKRVPKPGGAKKSIIPKVPKLKNIAGAIGDFALTIGKIALAGAFIAGLLKETIVKWFNTLEFDPTKGLGSALGAAIQDLFKADPGEESMGKRLSDAVKAGTIWGGIAALSAFLFLGPVGAIAAGLLVGAGVALWSMLDSDKGVNATGFVVTMKEKFRNAKNWALVGAIAGGAIGLAFGPIGIVSAVIVGAAAGAIFGFLQETKKTNAEKLKAQMQTTMDNDVLRPMDGFFKEMFRGVRETFKLMRAKMKLKMYPGKYKNLEDVYDNNENLRPGAEDTNEIKLMEQNTNQGNENLVDAFDNQNLMYPGSNKGLYKIRKKDPTPTLDGRVGYKMPKNAGWWDPDVLEIVASKALGPDINGVGTKVGAGDLIPGKLLFFGSEYIPLLKQAEEHAMNQKKLFITQLRHYQEEGGARPDFVPSSKTLETL